MKRTLGHIYRCIVPPSRYRAIPDKVLGNGCNMALAANRIGSDALETSNLGSRVGGGDPRIFARAFGHAAPSRVSTDIQHGCKSERDTVIGGLQPPLPRPSLPTRPGSKAAVSPSGTGKIVRYPCSTSRAKRAGIPSRLSPMAIR